MAFVITDGILEKYIPEDGQTKIVIPKDVTVIGVGVFENCTQIIDVELCEGIVEIQKNAFRYTGIEKVKIPDSLISIGEDAFVCRKKGTYDWENNDGYTELKLSKKHKVYHTDGKSLLKRNDDGTDTLIFCFKKGLTAYEVPASVSVINSNAFCYCTKLWNVVLPESLVTLHDDAFLNTKVAKLELSASVAYLGNNPHRWYGRRELVQVVVDENNPRFFIENDCLYERNSDKSFTLIRCENPKNKTVSIVEGTSAIGNSAFKDSDVETVNIPDSVCVIGDEAFAHCNKLKEIAIPAGTKTIGKCAFAGCSKLKKITLPASLENVADTIADNKCNIQLADGCTKLKMIDGIIYDADITTVKLVTNGALKKASVTLPDTVTIIGSAFAEKELQHLVLGSGIEEIPNGAFRLASITTIELSSDIKKIDANAFTSLADLSFGDDSNNHFIKLIVSAGSCAEQHVRKLIMDGKSLVAIGYKEDAHNKDLQDWSYTVEESEATILKYLGNDENITIPTTIQNRPVTVIGFEAFAGKRNAVSINIPSTIKTIGQAAFALCWNIACLELPEELETIGAGAFIYCKGLKNIVIPEKVAEIAAETFYGCDLLTAITLPKTISHIDNRWLSSDADDSWKKPEFRVWKETRTGTPLKVFAEKGSYTEAFLTEYVNTYQKSGEIVSYLTVVSVTASENTECQNAEVLPVTKELLDAYFDYKEVEDDDVKFYGAIPGTMKITAIKSPDENGVVAIPEKIDGKDVTFYGAVSYFGTPIKKLTIPKTMVAQISAEYFPEIQEELVIDLENPVWSTDGVSLLSKDGANLLRMCQKDRQTYTIPDGVVTICHYAFKWNRIAELTIPDTVTTVESGAFSYCDTLVTVNGGRNIVNYTSSSFGNTPWYTKTPCLVLGKTLLRWDTEESDVILPEGIEIIGENAFGAMCSKAMETVTLPSTLKEIGKSVFARKEKLRKICLPEGLTFIGERAFSGSKELAEIIIPKSVQEIGKEAFANCSNLKSICISHSVSGYKSGALFAATLTENTLSAGCFKGCSSLESFTIPEGTIAIGEEAFSGCSLLKEVLIPDSVVTIEREAFCSCLELEKLVLSKSVAELGVGVFPHGTTGWGAKPAKFCQIVVDAENESYSSIDGVLFSKDRRTLVACPSQLSASEYSVPEGVVEIALAAFEGCNNIRKIIVSSTVTTIGERAFAAMESLEEIIFPASLEYLEKNLLIACKSLKTIVWPLNLRVIGDKCFYGAGIDTLEIPATVETIGAYAFAGIKAKSVTLPKTVKVIGLSVFAGVPEIHVYDTIDSEAKPAEVSTDDMNGACNGRVGFIGITQKESYLVAACNAVWHEHTIVVHSASDDAIKYTVRMPDGQKRKVYCTYASSWGKDATFHFGAVDAIFKDLTADAKLDYALERLFYQEGITDEMLDTLGRYVSRNAKEITEKIVASDAVEQLRLLEPYGLIKVNAFAQRLDQADRAGAVQCKAWLLEWKHAADEKKKK